MEKLPRWFSNPFGLILTGMLLGIVSVCIAGAALAPTALELVLNNSDIYSLEAGDGIYFVRLRPILFSDPLCRRVDISRYKEGPRFGWTSVATFIDLTYAYHLIKGNITGDTPEIKARCAEGWNVPPPALSLDGTSIVLGGSMITAEGTWSFGTATASGGNAILLNGAQASGGFGTTLQLIGGEIYTFTADQRWYHWMRPGWTVVAAPVVPPVVVPPAASFSVRASGTATTRPLYDDAGKQIGTVAVGAKCEDAVIRKTTVEYHYTTNAAGLRGQAVCGP